MSHGLAREIFGETLDRSKNAQVDVGLRLPGGDQMTHLTHTHARAPLYLALTATLAAFAAGPVHAQADTASSAPAAQVAPASTTAQPDQSSPGSNQTNGQSENTDEPGQELRFPHEFCQQIKQIR
jgi:hypothetical protein